jgi:hypothetical protein
MSTSYQWTGARAHPPDGSDHGRADHRAGAGGPGDGAGRVGAGRRPGQVSHPRPHDMHGHDSGAESLPKGVTAYRRMHVYDLDSLAAERRADSGKTGEPKPYRYTSGNTRDFARPGLSLDAVAAAYKAAGFHLVAIPGELYRDITWTAERLAAVTKRTLPETIEQKLRAHEAFDTVQAAARLTNLPMVIHGFPHVGSSDELLLRFSSYSGGSIEHLYPF